MKYVCDNIDAKRNIISSTYSYEIENSDGEIKIKKAHIKLRYYSIKEIESLLKDAGFRIKEKYGWFDKCSLEKGHEIIVVAMK